MRALSVLLVLAALTGPAAADCRGLEGAYLFDVQTDAVSEALNARLGTHIKRFEDRFQTIGTFSTVGEDHVAAAGCMAHECTVDEAFLGIDVETCEPFVALLESGRFTDSFPAAAEWPDALARERDAWMANR